MSHDTTTTPRRIQPLFCSSVYDEPDRFAGWPANYGMWAFGDEIVVIFLVGWIGPMRGTHARDTGRNFEPVQARSTDGGRTWATEPFTGALPGAPTLSGDEHLDPELRAASRLTADDFVPLDVPIDFTDPETLVMCARTDLDAGSSSWFYVSRDRARSWSGPHPLPDFGEPGISARTDVVALSATSAVWLLTMVKRNGREGRVLAARTDDGGQTFTRGGWVGPEPDGLSIMSSSLRLDDGTLLSSVRCHSPRAADGSGTFWIDVYASTDEGRSWQLRATATPDTGPAGNPPVLLCTAAGLVVVYGDRNPGSGLRQVVSRDDGHTWAAAQVVTDDVAVRDMGYPRAVVLGDGSILACHYRNTGPESARTIEAVRWLP